MRRVEVFLNALLGASLYAKGWNAVLRLYGPLELYFDKTWRPGEIELVR